MNEFIKSLKNEIINCMTEEDKEFIDLEDRLYIEFGKEPTQHDIEKVIESLEEQLIVKRKNYPTRYISILN